MTGDKECCMNCYGRCQAGPPPFQGIVIDTKAFRPVDEMDIEAAEHAAQRWGSDR